MAVYSKESLSFSLKKSPSVTFASSDSLCIYLDSSTHDDQHYCGEGFQGYEMYSLSELPWGLRTEENFNDHIQRHNIEIDLSYAEFISTLTNKYVPTEKYREDRLYI